MKKSLIVVFSMLLFVAANAQKREGLAMTPPMGWSSWNTFAGNINETQIREVIDVIATSGLRDAGYVYVNLDDCWHGTRDSLGFIQCDPKTFPSGIKALSDYAHSKDLKLGIYSDAGCMTCASRLGSRGHEYQDALQYAKWGIDYLKYDWCYANDLNAPGAYKTMSDALAATGRDIVFSICEWGSNKPWDWAGKVGHLYRTTGDIGCYFDTVPYNPNWMPLSVLQIIDKQVDIRSANGPDHWNDPDMLEVGNGLTYDEDVAHFSMWCMFAAPLILGNDPRKMTAETKSIIMNQEAIAIDQDPLGVAALRFLRDGDLEFWFKPLEDGNWAMCILNRGTEAKAYTIDWQKFNLYDNVSNRFTDFDSKVYDVRDLWAHVNEGQTTKQKEVSLPGHSVKMYKLSVAVKKKK